MKLHYVLIIWSILFHSIYLRVLRTKFLLNFPE